MTRFILIVLAVTLLVASLSVSASAQHPKTLKQGPKASLVSAPKFHPKPGPTTY